MDPFIVEKGVPIPPSRWRGNGGTGQWRFVETLEVGDSFVIPKANARAAVYIYACAKKRGVKVTTRKQPDGTTRVWRTA